jgi:hypothetical protein
MHFNLINKKQMAEKNNKNNPNKKTIKRPVINFSKNGGKKNSFKPLITLLLISLLISLLLPYIKTNQQFSDENIALNVLEQKFIGGKYSDILIDNNKAIATLK